MLGDSEAAWDVLQETNRVLLEKREQFESGTSFVNWALTIAQFQTMAWLRDQRRNRLVATAEIVELMAEDARQLDAGFEARRSALHACLEQLPGRHREMLHQRYAHAHPLAQLSQSSGRSDNALKQLFFRLRGTLLDCINQRLRLEQS